MDLPSNEGIWVKWLAIKKDLGINIAYKEGCSCVEDDQEDDPNAETSDEDVHNICLCASGSGILKTDVKGAVAGAVGAWLINIIPVVSQIGLGSAIIGGGATNSVLKAFDYIFGEKL